MSKNYYKAHNFYWILVLTIIIFYIGYPYQNGTIKVILTKTVTKHTGYFAFAIFMNLLALSPLIKIFPNCLILQYLSNFRRAFGLSAFVFVCVHFASIIVRKTIVIGFFPIEILFLHPVDTTGFFAFLIFCFLAATSNDFSVKYLGINKWRKLHRIAYIAEALIFAHLVLQFKQSVVIGLAVMLSIYLLQMWRWQKG